MASTRNALFAPKGLPLELQTKLNEALAEALNDQPARKRLIEVGFVIPNDADRTPQALKAMVEGEVSRWSKVVKQSGVSAN